MLREFARRVSALTRSSLARCENGAMAIETAIIAPTLIALAIGGFEVSTIVARQTELQSAVAEAAAIVQAATPEDATARTAIRDILAESAGLEASQVTVTEVFRCGNFYRYVSSKSYCNYDGYQFDERLISSYIRVRMTDTYQPIWTQFGLGTGLTFNVSRTIQIG